MVRVFTWLIVVQFVVVAVHDLVDIPGWVHGSQVQAVLGRRKVLWATLANCVFPGVAVGFAVWFWNRPRPGYVALYWLIYCAISVVSAIGMWWVPYLFGVGANEKQRAEYAAMYAGTKQVLPERGGNVRPNVFHLGVHGLFLVTLGLAVGVWVR